MKDRLILARLNDLKEQRRVVLDCMRELLTYAKNHEAGSMLHELFVSTTKELGALSMELDYEMKREELTPAEKSYYTTQLKIKNSKL